MLIQQNTTGNQLMIGAAVAARQLECMNGVFARANMLVSRIGTD